jgi:hypothetical protein
MNQVRALSALLSQLSEDHEDFKVNFDTRLDDLHGSVAAIQRCENLNHLEEALSSHERQRETLTSSSKVPKNDLASLRASIPGDISKVQSTLSMTVSDTQQKLESLR